MQPGLRQSLASASEVRQRPASHFGLLSPRKLFLIVMPTERCQLRCAYCYEDFAHGKMTPRVRAALLAWMARRAPELGLLAIEWFGGEPLLACDVVEKVQAFARGLGREDPALTVRGSMTTNAVRLDPERLDRLVGLGVRSYQITLDGPREIHDRVRVTAGGAPTFARIWDNLCRARELAVDFEIHLRLHVSRDNVELLPAFIDECHRTFGADPRFRLGLRALRRLGGPRDASLPVLGRDQLDRQLARLSDYAENAGFPADRGPFEGPDPSPGCYAAAGYSWVVRSNGDLAKCTVALAHPNNRVGRLRDGGRLELDQTRLAGWTRGVFSGDRQALECPAAGFAGCQDLAI